MAGRIYLLNDKSDLMALEEAPYDSEKLLQEMLARHPDLLAGEQINGEEPRRWLLVTREMSIVNQEGESARWSLDHLFLDQDAVPTLIEVKRSSNTQIRREIVGQMLDYAANAVVYWPVEEIRAKFESRCERDDEDPDEALSSFLVAEEAPDEYWQRVKTNLQAGRIRMIFLADAIPAELRRVIEFLNEQMDPAEVLAIEVKQFVGEGMTTFVPRVLGQTETARQKKLPGSRAAKQWDEASFMEELEEQKGTDVRRIAEELLHWIEPRVTHIRWGKGATSGLLVPSIAHGNERYLICSMETLGGFMFRFENLSMKRPFNDAALRRQLLARINEIAGVQFDEARMTKWSQIPLAKLTTPEAIDKLKAALAWLIEQVSTECEKGT